VDRGLERNGKGRNLRHLFRGKSPFNTSRNSGNPFRQVSLLLFSQQNRAAARPPQEAAPILSRLPPFVLPFQPRKLFLGRRQSAVLSSPF